MVRPDQWDRVQDLFDRACALPESARRAFLRDECAGDDEVLREVESLLDHQTDASLELRDYLPSQDGQTSEEMPADIGGFRPVRVLGSGGMGIVYLAEQEEPVRRSVAIKLIKIGMDTEQVVSRFDVERQALAIMSHPCIARVYGAGATRDGRPYFVMEYVDGIPITRYCDDARLTTRERLELFIQVCEGIQHAHQKGIIHRDLKPSNLLVTSQDGRPTPKIIDFGIAKATDKRLTEATMLTEHGQVIGTMDYMSPEQARMTSQEIDTRTDVYSLGVILYELLVGRLPFDSEGAETAFDERLRQIRESDPPRPSARVRRLGESTQAISDRRGTDPGTFIRDLRGDLDWIVMKALEKSPERRYASASELAADIERSLRHEPVLARPPAAGYRLGKFVRRHRLGVAFAAVLLLALLGGIAGTTAGLVRAKRAESDARQAEATAVAEAKSFEKIADYMVETFKVADPGRTAGEALTAREMLDARSATVREELADEPRAQGRVMTAMAQAYSGLGLYAESLQLLEDALPVLRRAYGQDHAEVYNALNELGLLANRLGDHDKALEYLEQTLAMAERLHGPDHEDLPVILKNLADVHILQGDTERARPLLERALEIRTKLWGAESMAVAKTLSGFGEMLRKSGDFDGAVDMAHRSLAIRHKLLAPGDPGLAPAYFFLAQAQAPSGLGDTAIESYRQAQDLWEQAYGANHEMVGNCDLEIAKVLAGLGRLDEAHVAYVRARQIIVPIFDRENPETARTLAEYLEEFASLLEALERPGEAAAERAEADRLRRRHGL